MTYLIHCESCDKTFPNNEYDYFKHYNADCIQTKEERNGERLAIIMAFLITAGGIGFSYLIGELLKV